jgi:hypothetical protein
MKRLKYFSLSRLSSGQSGQALILVLIFLMLGSLTLVPTLSHISTALKTGETYEQNTNQLYTADSGVEDALWRIKYDFMGPDYNPYDFASSWPYQTEDINDMAANFTISNVWFPTDVNLVDPSAPGFIDMTPNEVSEMMDSEKLVVSGSALPGQPYRILIDFNPDAGDNITIKSLGVWLPRDFTYVPDSCSLDDGNPFTHPVWEADNVTVAEAPGGTTVLWSYDGPYYPYLSDFPGYDSVEFSFGFTFEYTPPAEHPSWLPAGIAWVTTEMHDQYGNPKFPQNAPENVPVSWDIDTRYFKITSSAGDAQIEAYSSKNELRQMGDAMAGDYVAFGNALLLNNPYNHCRDIWDTPSSFTLDSIPENADAVYAFLYWSAWRNEDAISPVFSDSCSDFDNWIRTFGAIETQTKVPDGDGISSGSWSYTPGGWPYGYYSRVDETTPNDSDYITGTSNYGAYRLFDFSDFTVPSGSEIDNLTIYFRARDISGTNPNNNLSASIRVSNYRYDASTSVDPTSEWTTYSYTWDENPRTGQPWTWQEINGGSSNPLLEFGISSTDFNPDIQISMVYAEIEYYASRWTVTSGGNPEFEGEATGVADPDPRVLTLENGVDLTSHGSGMFSISWDQDETGNLSEDDIFYYAFSGDGGNTWSPYFEAFRGNNPPSPFTTAIPEEYVTNNFKIRFYFNFNSSSESVFLDNIEITHLPVDTDVVFKINDQQVYFDGSDPAIGLGKVTADRSYAMRNYLGGPHGFSYACVKDVSALVKAFPVVPGEEYHTGNAKYTVGDVTADTKNGYWSSEIAFAAWSLIIVYASPQTAGHYIYIRDDNFYSHTSGDTSPLDFDQDGIPGGTITGFKIPNPITDSHGQITESVAAKLTCFIVEGDSWYYGDYIRITGEQSGLSEYLSNPQSPYDNVWNDSSYPGTISDGVDIDTFEILWTDGILTPKDKQLQVDMISNTDAWNLVYFIISVRSETVTSGTTYYTITGG